MSNCNWCYEKGHNSVTCPEKKKYITDNPNSYTAEREAAKVARREARKKTPRKCGFCRKTGHNAKTCHTKQTIQKNYRALNSVYRRKVLEEMCIMGLGTGALVNFKPRGNEPIVALVKSVKWNKIYAASDGSSYCLQLERVMDPPEDHFSHLSPQRRRSLGSRHLAHALTRPMMGEFYQRDDVYQRHLDAGGSEIEVISPIPMAHINPPSDWLNGGLSNYDNENPFKSQGKDETLWNLSYELNHFAYYAGTLGLKEIERYFSSFIE
jgi:hypothetical protein